MNSLTKKLMYAIITIIIIIGMTLLFSASFDNKSKANSIIYTSQTSNSNIKYASFTENYNVKVLLETKRGKYLTTTIDNIEYNIDNDNTYMSLANCAIINLEEIGKARALVTVGNDHNLTAYVDYFGKLYLRDNISGEIVQTHQLTNDSDYFYCYVFDDFLAILSIENNTTISCSLISPSHRMAGYKYSLQHNIDMDIIGVKIVNKEAI